MRSRLAVCTTGIFAIVTMQSPALFGQDYPVRPVRIMTSAPGGASNFVARIAAAGLTSALQQNVIVDNRPGLIAIETAARADPDGYTLLVNSNLVWVTPLLQKVRYDALRDLAAVSLLVSSPNVIVVHPSLPAQSVRDLVALAKARPGEIHYSSGSTGSTPHLAAELFQSMSGTKLVMVPYKGAGPALTALVGGEVQVSFPGAGSAAPHLKSGRLRGLGVTSLKPSPLLPGLPAVAETIPGFETIAMYGLFAPSRTPQFIISRLQQALQRHVTTDDVRNKLAASGVDSVGSTAADFAVIMKTDLARMAKVIKDSGIRID